jgi:Uma2 family endonuclease
MVWSEKAMRSAKVRFNHDDYLLLPEDKRYEILDGEIYVIPAPSTRHQRISRQLEMALIQHVEQFGLGEILQAPYDVVLSHENVVQPDILLVLKERSGIITAMNLQGAPDLVVEILSPATRGKDAEIKRKIYAQFGVREYWIVNPEADTIEVLAWSESGYTSAGLFRNPEYLSTPLLPNFDLPLSQIF